MKNIVLDTNILHKESLNSGRMQILYQLTADSLVTVYIPEIVKREFITKRISEISESIASIQSSLKTILRKVDSDSSFKESTKSLGVQTASLMESVKESVESEFEDWITLLNGNILNFEPNQINDVLDDYFIGRGAFKSQKNREDFPDSIIHHSICNLVNEVGEIYVILNDGAFKKEIAGQENIIAMNSLIDLFKLKDIEQHLASRKLQEYQEYFEGDLFLESLNEYFNNQKEIIEQIYIEDGIGNINLLGIKTYAAELNYPNPEDITELVISNFYTISETEFTAEISFKTSVGLAYVCEYGDFREISMDTSRDITMSSMNGDGMCDLEEVVLARYVGNINLSFTSPQSVKSIEGILRNNKDFTSISITLDIDTASIIELVTY
jgi:hypothetical protein